MPKKKKQEDTFKFEFKGIGLLPGERKIARKQFKAYKEAYHINSFSDLHLLEELIFRETLQQRFKQQVEDIETNNRIKKNTKYIPTDLFEVIDENLKQIIIVKEKLGLFENKNEKDPYKYIQVLKRKFEIWREEHQGSRTTPCPHCKKMILLRIRTSEWEAQKHPCFKDKILANDYLWKLYREGKLSKEDVAGVLHCPIAYVDWLAKKVYKDSSK